MLPFAVLPPVMVPQEPTVVHLWENGAPGFESRKSEPEEAKEWWVKNVHNPSITVFLPPKEIATGAAVVVAPGGGHSALVYNAEGVDAAKYLNSIGVAAFVLKYRLAREPNSPYQLGVHAKQDAQRAFRLLRFRAGDYGIDPNRLGILGFSAGGEVVHWVAYDPGQGDPAATDPIERQSAKPNFQMLVYPGPLGIPDRVPSDASPAFFVTAFEDEGPFKFIMELMVKFKAAKVLAECHIYAKGAHAFNMGQRSEYVTLKHWPDRMKEWLTDGGWLKSKG